ncbi:MAG TPA: hypothetical protein VF205_08860, partial [Nitrospiraceae bacterium]
MHPKFLSRSLLFITSATLVDRPRTDCTVGNRTIARTASGHDRPRDWNRLTSLTASSPKTREDVLFVAGWLTRIPWWTLLLAWSAINVWQAVQLELFHDEAYYWMFSRFPDLGYFDHPPMVAWWIILGAWAGGELGVRLASVICWTLGGWLFVQLARPAPATAAVLWYALLPLSSFMG